MNKNLPTTQKTYKLEYRSELLKKEYLIDLTKLLYFNS